LRLLLATALGLCLALVVLSARDLGAAPSLGYPPPTPSSVRTAVADQTACALSYYVNPSTGSDANAGTTSGAALQHAQEIKRRQFGCTVNTSTTWTILGSLNAGDWITTPAIGPAGRLLITGTPGATTLATGTLTAAAAHSGNNQGTITDSSQNWSTGGPGSTSLVGFRLDITGGNGGTRTGTTTWITSDKGSHVAGVGDPELVVTSAPIPFYLTSQTLAAGDTYAVRSLPMVRNLQVGPIDPDTGQQEHLVFEGLSWDNQAPYGGTEVLSVVSATTQANHIRFIGCAMGNISGTFFAHVSQWGDYSLDQGSGNNIYAYGSVFGGDMECLPGAYCFFSQGSIATPTAANLSTTCIQVYGTMIVGASPGGGDGFGCFGAPNQGIQVVPGGTLTASDTIPIWGASNGTYGVQALAGSRVMWGSTRPTITGTSGDVSMSGTSATWASLANGSTANGVTAGPTNAAWIGLAASNFFALDVTLVGGTKTQASGKNLGSATLLGCYLKTPTTAVGSPAPSISGNNVVVTSYSAGAVQAVTDASTYTCLLAGAL
jgi:hypothetical protein